MKLTVTKPFAWAHRGIDVEHYEPGQVIDTEDQDLIAVSLKQKWTVKGEQPQPPAGGPGSTPPQDPAQDPATGTGTPNDPPKPDSGPDQNRP